MDTTWAESESWESSLSDDADHYQVKNNVSSSPGTFHCKAALRDHESNMKLYMYRQSYNYLHALEGTIPYDAECLLLLPDLWRCFFMRSHNLKRVLCPSSCKDHSTSSPAFTRWAESYISKASYGDLVIGVLRAEEGIWKKDLITDNWEEKVYRPAFQSVHRPLYLVTYLNLCIMVLNYRDNPSRPDVSAVLPGIVEKLDDDYYRITYNEYLKAQVYKEAVRLITPIFDQILQKDIFLNLCDKINERLNVVISARVISNSAALNAVSKGPDDPDVFLFRDMSNIIKWGDDLLYAKHNRAFELIGKFEAYCVSAILMHDNPLIWDNNEFQRNLLEDDRINSPDLYVHSMSLCSILNTIPEQSLAELHGLWRIWGHPIIDLEGGLKKMEATCLKPHSIDKKETLTGTRTFKLLYMRNYFIKHGHYPLSNMASEAAIGVYRDHLHDRDIEQYEGSKDNYNENCYINKCIRKDIWINDRASAYSHADWDSVVLLQSFQIPQSINLATMIKDKAISQTRSELIASVQERNSVFDPKKRRGVLKWLSEQTIRLKDYLSNVDNHGLPDNDKIIGLYPKERELKTKARFFSLMSYNMRMYITATEEMLGKYLLPYFPMITMSDTLLNMIIRLYNMTTSIGMSGNKVVYSMNIDFSKWNQNMREATNAGIFENIDKILGFRNLISRTHQIFRESLLYLCSGEYIPRIIRRSIATQSPYSRIGDESGKEGLRQKGWTITTVCDIVSLAYLHGVQIELIGGGDNQVLTVTIASSGRSLDLPQEEQMMKIRSKMNRFRNALAKKMDKRGLPLKLEETWISHRLLMYNKIMYLDGVPLKGRLKVASRLFSNSNEGICTLGNVTSTLGTGFMALSAKDYTPVFAWIMSRIFTFIAVGQFYLFNPISGTRRMDKQILLSSQNLQDGKSIFGMQTTGSQSSRHKELTSFSTDNTLSLEDLYLTCLYYHKILGGPSIGTPYSYLMKGFPDPLSEALAFNYHMLDSRASKYIKVSVDNLTAVSKSVVKHWEHLLEDPVSVNHDAPSHGVAALRSQAEQVLKEAEIQNKNFKRLISLGDTDYLRQMSEKLCRPAKIEPRLLHDIVGATIPGYVNTILSKVDQSSTLSKLSTTHDVITSVYTSEVMYYIYLAKKIKIRKGHMRSTCPTEDARLLRNYTWGREIIGVTTPHPSSFLRPVIHNNNNLECDQNYVSVLIQRKIPEFVLERGSFRPYFGSYTAEKFKTSVLASSYGDEDILKRSLKIQKLLGWRYLKGSFMYNIIQGILRCVTNADPDKFLPTPEEITGDVEHRYHDMATKHGGIPTNLIKLYTHASCNTSSFIDHSKGAANESLHFQAVIIYASMLGILLSPVTTPTSFLCHFHETCNLCIKPVVHPEDDQELQSNVDLLSCPDNELMYIDENDIPIHYHNCRAFLRAQEKQERMEKREGKLVNFSEPKERTSWLLLVCTSIITSQDKMKRSSLKLMLEDLSVDEVTLVLLQLVIYVMVISRKPWSTYQIDDIEDIVLKYQTSLDILFNDSKLAEHYSSKGIEIPSSVDDYRRYFYMIIQLASLESAISLGSAICKYQDPEFAVSRLLLLSDQNPSTKNCKVCVDAIVSLSKMPDSQENPISCSLHGVLKDNMMYHLFSLDKLSRYKGPPLRAHDEEQSANKRKRGFSLFSSIKFLKSNKGGREMKKRMSSFLFRKEGPHNPVEDLLICGWTKVRISNDIEDATDRLSKEKGISRWEDPGERLTGTTGSVITRLHGLTCVFDDIAANMLPQMSTYYITYEVDFTPGSVSHHKKIFELLDMYLQKYENIRWEIRFVPKQFEDLEMLNIGVIKDLVVGHQTSSQRKFITLYEDGDCCLNFSDRMRSPYIPILVSWDKGAYVEDKAYYLTNSENAYEQMANWSNNPLWSYKWDILQPNTSITHPYPIVLKMIRCQRGSHISESILLNAMDNHRPSFLKALCDEISSSIITRSELSITYSLYTQLVNIKSGIVSESTYDLVVDRLGHGLQQYSLRASAWESVPWRCSVIIRMIIAIKILSDTDRSSAMRYYSMFHSFSYKPGTYREIILHRKRIPSASYVSLMNWTPHSLGSKIKTTCDDIAEWLEISWRSGHKYSHIIHI